MNRKKERFWGLFACFLSSFLWVLCLPPFEFPEAAYIAFVPLLLWLKTAPAWRTSLVVGLFSGTAAWFAILVWLRHVTLAGTLGLAFFLGLFFLIWLVFARALLPRVGGHAFPLRLLAWAALAGGWVVLEWVREWIFYGFPWAPLALSQWERPVVLQIAAWSGASGVSFLLILFNACVAHTLWMRATAKERKFWSGWFSPDLYAGILLLVFCIVLFFKTLPARGSFETLFRAGVVQPYILPELKWEVGQERENIAILERQTKFVGAMENDLILWPESATPWPVMGNAAMQLRVERLVEALQRPILMGNLAYRAADQRWENGIFLVEPEGGLYSDYYVKRRLVPFGEYVPAPFDWVVERFVPTLGAFVPGHTATLLPLAGQDRVIRCAPLVCYEDIFPELARSSVRAGAEVLFVATNNAWYGEEGGASQHAAHSVLRAVENRRPVMRCGNGGWSGWIDAYGTVREVLRDDRGSIYFRGGGTLTVMQERRWRRQQSFYTRHGNWFIGVSGGFVAAGLFLIPFGRDQ
jgi:apolipoprotein N-acyltransferase